MKACAIIQARTGSTRLPGKVLMDLAGKPVLQRVIERVSQFRRVDDMIVATSVAPSDDAIESLCDTLNLGVYRGDEFDVLGRFCQAARQADADLCVRITADCPLIDPGISDHIIHQFLESDPPVDYASNKIPQSYPRGLDTEVFTREALEKAARNASHAYERTHVTAHMYQHPESFRLLSVVSDTERASWRWTLDTKDDLAFVRAVYAKLAETCFSWLDVIELLRQSPRIRALNSHVRQKDVWEG
ncbi:MAG: cytidylyltransferase domain-containing protein [Pirellulaceae bacterium]